MFGPNNSFSKCAIHNEFFALFCLISTIAIIFCSSAFAIGPSTDAGGGYSLYLDEKGSVWAWGCNSHGELGDGTTTTRNVPIKVKNLTDVIAITAAGNVWGYLMGAYPPSSLALDQNGKVWAWGGNRYGQLGDGTTTDRYVPVQVLNLTNIIAIASYATHCLALRNDGTVWAWGKNWTGQLGDGTTTNRNTPVQVSNLSNVIDISVGHSHSLALKNNGTVWAWGANYEGELGDGATTERNTPVQVKNLDSIKKIAAGMSHSLAIKNDGTVWAWGWNEYGQLGDGTIIDRHVPVQVLNLKDLIAIDTEGDFWNISASISFGLKKDGTVWKWGGSLSSYDDTPVQLSSLNNIIDISIGTSHYFATRNDGTVWAWGFNPCGGLGDGTTTTQDIPVQVKVILNLNSVVVPTAIPFLLLND